MCLKNRNAKSFIANKINIIAKAPVRYSYSSFSRTKLIHNILAKLIHNTFSFLQILFALLHTPLAESKVHSNSYFLVPQINLITLFYPVRLMVWLKGTPMLVIVLSFFGSQKNLSIFIILTLFYPSHLIVWQKWALMLVIFLSFSSDLDECQNDDTHNCHQNAMCSNTIGSFDCYCKAGFAGNGISCTGN